MFISRMRIGSQLLMIVAGAVLGILSVGGYTLYEVRAILFEDRKVKTEHVVHVAESLIAHYAALEQSGAMTREEAQEAARRCEQLHPGFIKRRFHWNVYLDPKANQHLTEGLRKAGLVE